MALVYPDPKDPNEILDYKVDWSVRLAGDKIVTSNFSITSGSITISMQDHTDFASTVWLSGGVANTTVQLLCRITTLGGRTMDQSVELSVQDK